MESFIAIAIFVFGICYFLFYDNKNYQITKLHVSRHGHRCYLDSAITDGEFEIVSALAANLSHQEYFIFNNLIIPSGVLGTTQIDHVVVSRYGIFVIENKDMTGWIYANKNHKNWTQTFVGGQKYQFQNPLFQNFAHISALKEQLPFVKNRLFNIVVFSGKSEFKTYRPEGVLYYPELCDYIKTKNEPIFKEVELLVIIGKLSMLCQTGDVSQEEHVENIKKRFEK